MKTTSLLKNQLFPVILEKEKTGGYVVINPAIEGCYSQGETVEDALDNIKEATELCIEESKVKSKMLKPKNISLHLINVRN